MKAFPPTCIVLTVVVLLHSCATPKRINRPYLTNLKDSLTAINGDYKNLVSDSGYDHASLWAVLISNNKGSMQFSRNYHYPLSYVRFTVQSKRRIEASLYVDSTVFERIVLKGRARENGYFSVRRKISCFGLPAVFYSYKEHKIRIGKTEDNLLHVDLADYRIGWVLIIFSGGGLTQNRFSYPLRP